MNNDTKKTLKQISDESKRETDIFFKKHIFPISDTLTLVVKMHLFLENVINIIIKTQFNKPEKITNKRRFSDKVAILEAEEIIPLEIISRIKVLNKIRNKLVHNLNYLPSKKELDILRGDTKAKSGISQINDLKSSMSYLIGYLQATSNVNSAFPFLMDCIRRKNYYKNDMNFDFPTIFKVGIKDTKTVLKGFRM